MFTNKDIRCFVPTCNRPNLLQTTLKTLLWQEGGPWDIWVLDNSTNDETKNLIEKNFPQVHYIDNRSDRKPMANLRKLREMVITPYSLTLHDDDLLAPNYLKNALKILNTYPNINGIFAKLKLFHKNRFPFTVRYRRGTKHWLINSKEDFALSFWDLPSCTWTGSIIKSNLYKNMPAEELYKVFGRIHDWPMLIETVGYGNNCIFTDSYVYYRIHGTSDTRDNNTGISLNQLKNWVNYYKKFAEQNQNLQKVYNKYIYDRACIIYKYHLTNKEKQNCKNIEEFLKRENLLFAPVSFWRKIRAKWYFKPFNRFMRIFYNVGYYKQFLRDLPKKEKQY